MLIYFKKYLIVKNENKKEKKIAIRFTIEKFKFSDNNIFLIPKAETAPRIGMDSKNDIFAESVLL